MRVVAGKWRGRVLKSPKGDAVRPTTDRVKEAMFSILGPDLVGSVLVDLCCGSGGLGIEALSRGADRVILIDKSRVSLDLARANLQLCGAPPDTFDLVRDDCLRWLGNWLPPEAPCFLVADPPYLSGLPSSILDLMFRLISESGFKTGIIEHGSREKLETDDCPSAGAKIESRRYGKSTLTIIRSGR